MCERERERERERVSVSENGGGRVDLENCSFFRGQWVILVMTKKKFLFVSPTYTPQKKKKKKNPFFRILIIYK